MTVPVVMLRMVIVLPAAMIVSDKTPGELRIRVVVMGRSQVGYDSIPERPDVIR